MMKLERRGLSVVVVAVVPGAVSDVQGLVLSPVGAELSQGGDQTRQAVPGPGPVDKPLVVVGRLVVDLGEGGEDEARDDGGEGGDGERRETDSRHGEGRHRDPDYHVGQHVPLLLHRHVVDHVDGPGEHVPGVGFGGGGGGSGCCCCCC